MSAANPVTHDPRRFAIRLPRPLWIGLVAVGLAVVATSARAREDAETKSTPVKPFAEQCARLRPHASMRQMHARAIALATLGSQPQNEQESDESPPVPKSKFRIASGTFDRLIYGEIPDAVAARDQLEKLLVHRIECIDQTCGLTDAQKQKLRLAGQGDIKRFFDRVERLKSRVDVDEDGYRDSHAQARTLHRNYKGGLVSSNSLFGKAVKNILTVEQAAKYAGRNVIGTAPCEQSLIACL